MAISNEELRLILTARDRMSSVIGGSTRSLSAFRTMGKLAGGALGFMGRAASIAGGVIVGALGVQALRGVSRAVGDLAKQAWDSAAAWERQEIALTALVSREVQDENAIQKVISTRQIALELTDKEQVARERAMKRLDDVNARITIGQQRMEEYSGKKKQSEATWMSMNEAMRKNLRTRDELIATLAILEEKEGRIVTLTKMGTEYTLTQEEAYGRAAGRVAELQGWLEKLDLNSPFEAGSIAQTFRQALMFGFTTEEAERLTVAMGDYTAATGASGTMMQRIAYNLGQIKSIGHVTGREIRDLANAGFPIVDVLAKAMGVTKERLMEMVSEGLVPAEIAVESIVTTIERDFGGAMGKMAEHWTAFFTVIGKIKSIGLRKLFTPIAEAFGPTFTRVLDKLTSPEFQSRLEEIGFTLGEKIGKWLEEAPGQWEAFRTAAGDAIWDFFTNLKILPEPLRNIGRLIGGWIKGEYSFKVMIEELPAVKKQWDEFIQDSKDRWDEFVQDAKDGWGRVRETFEEEGFVRALNVALDEMWGLLPKGLRDAITEFERLWKTEWNTLWEGATVISFEGGRMTGMITKPGLRAKLQTWGQDMATALKEGFVGVVKEIEAWVWDPYTWLQVTEKAYSMGEALAKALLKAFGVTLPEQAKQSEFQVSMDALVEGFVSLGIEAARNFIEGFLTSEAWAKLARDLVDKLIPEVRPGQRPLKIGEISEAERRPELRAPLPGPPGAYRGGYAGDWIEPTQPMTQNYYIQPGAIIINAPTREAEGIGASVLEALQAAGQQ